jgi:hypothetical protein
MPNRHKAVLYSVDLSTPVEIDGYYPALVTIDLPHHRLHDGKAFFVDVHGTGKTAFCYALQVPAAGEFHFVYGFNASDAFSLNLFEGASLSSSGAAVTAYNHDRNSANTSSLQVSTDPAISSTGTIIRRMIINSGVGITDYGGSQREVNEVILKNSTIYMLSATGSSAAIHLDLSWYET